MARRTHKQQTVVVNGKEYPEKLVAQARRIAEPGEDLEEVIRWILADRELTRNAKPANPNEPARIYLGFGNLLKGR